MQSRSPGKDNTANLFPACIAAPKQVFLLIANASYCSSHAYKGQTKKTCISPTIIITNYRNLK